MADTLVVRVTGQEQAHRVPLAVNLVMTDRTLLRGDDEPAEIQGYDVLPAEWARDLVGNTLEDTTQVWLRRLYSCPGTGQLVALDSRQRRAPEGLAEFVRLRDGGSCRTPWCDAPIRHIDHAVGDASGGQTQASNLNGRCERCNYAKEALGWHSQPRPGPRHTVVVTTPTGHTYRATAPPLPSDDGRTPSRMEIYVRELLLTA